MTEGYICQHTSVVRVPISHFLWPGGELFTTLGMSHKTNDTHTILAKRVGYSRSLNSFLSNKTAGLNYSYTVTIKD